MGSKVMLIKENIIEAQGDGLISCRIKHPKTNEASVFFLNQGNQQILELIKYERPYQCWAIDDQILKDGSLFMLTFVNPLYLLLPYLKQKSTRFMELDSLLEDEDFPDMKKLVGCCAEVDLFTDVKDVEGRRFYRFNESKTMQWLKSKVHQVASVLEKKEISVSSHISVCSDFASNKKNSPTAYLTYAWEMISEYLDEDSSTSLRNALGTSIALKEEVENSCGLEPPSKKLKLDDLTPLEDYSQHNIQLFHKVEKLTAAQKKLKNVDKRGMKPISSFFGSPKSK